MVVIWHHLIGNFLLLPTFEFWSMIFISFQQKFLNIRQKLTKVKPPVIFPKCTVTVRQTKMA